MYNHRNQRDAILALEDGSVFRGFSFGATKTVQGEAVFNTAMTGYQETLTDPSYYGQIVTMTTPHIGNYGVNAEDEESAGPKVAGFVVRELSPVVSNWRATDSLDAYLKSNGIPGISGVDTRAITKRIRVHGALKACISTENLSDESALEKAREWTGITGKDFVKEVTCRKSFTWDPSGEDSKPFTVVGTNLGDPSALKYAHNSIQSLLTDYPIFGICLGHQILTHAIGANTYKLKFGHRGANQPVKNVESQKVAITSQNHGFAADKEKLEEMGAIVTEYNLNDQTVSGMRLKDLPVFSVQYHPEASPGPNDANHLFQAFHHLVSETKKNAI